MLKSGIGKGHVWKGKWDGLAVADAVSLLCTIAWASEALFSLFLYFTFLTYDRCLCLPLYCGSVPSL